MIVRAALIAAFLTVTPILEPKASQSDTVAALQKNRICFLNGRDRTYLFWRDFEDFIQLAARNLGIELSVYRANSNPFRQLEILNELAQNDACQAIITRTLKRNGIELLEIAERAKKPIFLVNSSLTIEQQKEMDDTGRKFIYWVGEMLPDDELAGYQQAKALTLAARKNKLDDEGMVHMVALAGPHANNASLARVSGLRRYATEDKKVNIAQIVNSEDVSQQIAAHRTSAILERYPQTNIVWTHNDQIALGVSNATRNSKRKILIGGMDWSHEAIEEIKKGNIELSLGGHVMHGAWALILVYDYLNGIQPTVKSVRIPLEILTSDNYQAFKTIKAANNFDFSTYSKVLNRSLGKYNFALPNLGKSSTIE